MSVKDIIITVGFGYRTSANRAGSYDRVWSMIVMILQSDKAQALSPPAYESCYLLPWQHIS